MFPLSSSLSSLPLLKYPRTAHLEGSRLQPGDSDDGQTPLAALHGLHVVIEEKLDGANAAVSFSAAGELLLQSRGHYLAGGAGERQFNLFKHWAATHEAALLERLEDRYVMYGEWCFAKHSCWYDRLPAFSLRSLRPKDGALPADVSPACVSRGQLDALGADAPRRSDATVESVAFAPAAVARSADWRLAFEQALAQERLPLDLVRQQTNPSDLTLISRLNRMAKSPAATSGCAPISGRPFSTQARTTAAGWYYPISSHRMWIAMRRSRRRDEYTGTAPRAVSRRVPAMTELRLAEAW